MCKPHVDHIGVITMIYSIFNDLQLVQNYYASQNECWRFHLLILSTCLLIMFVLASLKFDSTTSSDCSWIDY